MDAPPGGCNQIIAAPAWRGKPSCRRAGAPGGDAAHAAAPLTSRVAPGDFRASRARLTPDPEAETLVPYIIAQPCIGVKDRACVDVCPVDCIYEDEKMLYIHPDECIDCGACEPECPVTAIFPEEDVPEQWKEFIAINRDIFKGPNPPGKPQKKG
jgi:ferredoxin